ncbi:MAG: zf-TFIIB domain-containing protein [Methylococcales bacterium]|nr:zf-TFIIB domain-containing protein [Methylococcales bacterium]
MKCTSCNKGILSPSFIDGLFRAHTCTECGGNWVLIEDYLIWKERNPEFEFSDEVTCEAEDSTTTLLCPVTGTVMRKFRLAAKNSHRLDYSSSVGGVWLDKGEWELLKKEGLAGSLNAVLTEYWQNNIRLDSAKDSFEAIYKDKFGLQTYGKAREFREWLNNQPCKADLRAYILADDPYSARK